MPTLFEPVKIRDMAVPNRFVLSATPICPLSFFPRMQIGGSLENRLRLHREIYGNIRWESGERKAPDCISCNKCLEALYKGQQLHCAQQKSRTEG